MKVSYWVLKTCPQNLKRYSCMFTLLIKKKGSTHQLYNFCKAPNRRTEESTKSFHLSSFFPAWMKHTQLFLTRWSFLLKNRNTVLLSINCQNKSFFTAHVYFWGCSPAVGSGMHWSLNTISRLQHENKQVQSTTEKYLYKLLHIFQDKKKNSLPHRVWHHV